MRLPLQPTNCVLQCCDKSTLVFVRRGVVVSPAPRSLVSTTESAAQAEIVSSRVTISLVGWAASILYCSMAALKHRPFYWPVRLLESFLLICVFRKLLARRGPNLLRMIFAIELGTYGFHVSNVFAQGKFVFHPGGCRGPLIISVAVVRKDPSNLH